MTEVLHFALAQDQLHPAFNYLDLDYPSGTISYRSADATRPLTVSGLRMLLKALHGSHHDLSTHAYVQFDFGYEMRQPALLSENDQDLYRWVSGQEEPPAEHGAIVGDIRAHIARSVEF